MIHNVEIDQAINPREVKLSKIEADKQAFTLMMAFRTKLFSSEEFRKAASGLYLNLYGDQSKNADRAPREISFGIGGNLYRVHYSSSNKEQTLFVTKDGIGASEKGVFLEPKIVIDLRSRRFVDQKPIGSAKIEWYRPVGAARMDDYNPQVNTTFAVDQALQMLGELTPQAPQK